MRWRQLGSRRTRRPTKAEATCSGGTKQKKNARLRRTTRRALHEREDVAGKDGYQRTKRSEEDDDRVACMYEETMTTVTGLG
uniref:Uncharacterized protein n=1 Tax=Cucumis melo TaxID=3656 RepID=A0A9I9DSJ5_CUCME